MHYGTIRMGMKTKLNQLLDDNAVKVRYKTYVNCDWIMQIMTAQAW